MKQQKRLSTIILAVLAICLIGFTGCAEDPGLFDRTAPNKIDKALFAGEWLYVPTVVDIPSSGGFTFVGEMAFGNTPKIIWDIQEKFLIAYKVVETVKGSEKGWRQSRIRNYWSKDPEKFGTFEDVYVGPAVAAYKITAHFDVIRDYNTATGEQNNILVENTTDKPWYMRKFMRVDWSQNVLPNYSFLFGGVDTTPLEYYVPENETNNPDRPELESNYISIVGMVYGAPQSTGYCSTYYAASGDCAPVTIKLRHAFKKIDPTNDYEPREYNDVPMDKYGFFRTERYGYDTDWGHTETGRDYKINRWNLWAKSTKIVTNQDGTTTKVRIPFNERTTKPIVYWLSSYFPVELEDVAFKTADEWDLVFKRTVAWMRYLERKGALTPKSCQSDADCGGGTCMTNTSGTGQCYVPNPKLSEDDIEYKEIRQDLDKDGGRMFVLCHNPSEPTDHAECLKESNNPTAIKKIGDLRYSLFYWVPESHYSSPLGYGPSSADPETGEIFWATAYIYGAPLETYAQMAKDIVDMLTGKLDVKKLYTGQNVVEYINSLKSQGLLSGLTQGLNTKVDVKTGLKEWEKRYTNVYTPTPREKRVFKGKVKYTRKQFQELIKKAGLNQVSPDYVTARLNKIKGTRLEEMLINNEVIRGMNGLDINDPFNPTYDPELKDKVSPLTWMNPVKIGEKRRQDLLFMKNNVYKAEFLDDSILGLAQKYQREGIEGKALYTALLKEIYLGVNLHEVGHTVGLRHNFAGSADIYNYFDDFYKLRGSYDLNTQTGKKELVLQPRCRTALDNQTGQNVTRCFPNTTAQVQGRMTEYQYSTIMDYGAKFNSDFHGLGRYDHMAIMFGYGGLVETYRQIKSTTPDDKDTEGLRFTWTSGVINHPFTLLNDTIGVANNLIRGVGSDAMMKLEKANKPVRDWTYVEVPYRFCGDEYRGNLGCDTWDQGIDAFEVVENAINNLKFYYLFDAFKRDRFSFGQYGSASSYFNRILSRYFAVMSGPSRYWALLRSLGGDAFANQWVADPWGGMSIDMAVKLSVQYMAESLSSPEPGCFQLDSVDNVYKSLGNDITPTNCVGTGKLHIPIGVGKFPYTTYDKDAGYFYFTHAKWIGSFWEKLASIMTLTDSNAYFIGEFVSELGRGTSIGYNTYMQKELTTILGSMVLSDVTKWAGVVRNGKYEPKDPTRPETDYTGLPRVQPSITSLDLKLYSIIYSLAFLPAGFDQSFIDNMTVFVEGKAPGHLVSLPASSIQRFKDPFSGQTYLAFKSNYDGRLAVGFELLKEADTLAKQYDTATGSEKDKLGAKIKEKLEVIQYLTYAYRILGNIQY